MAAPKRPTHVVVKPNLYLMGYGGKLQEQPLGKQLVLNDKQAVRMLKRGLVQSLKEADMSDLTEKE